MLWRMFIFTCGEHCDFFLLYKKYILFIIREFIIAARDYFQSFSFVNNLEMFKKHFGNNTSNHLERCVFNNIFDSFNII